MPWKAPSLFSAIFLGEDKEATADIEPKPHMSQFDQFHFFFTNLHYWSVHMCGCYFLQIFDQSKVLKTFENPMLMVIRKMPFWGVSQK